MKVEKYLKDLGITKEGKVQGDKYIVTLQDSDDFARMYSILETSNDLDIDDSLSLISNTASKIFYASSDYEITLNANFMSDTYTIVAKEVNEKGDEE